MTNNITDDINPVLKDFDYNAKKIPREEAIQTIEDLGKKSLHLAERLQQTAVKQEFGNINVARLSGVSVWEVWIVEKSINRLHAFLSACESLPKASAVLAEILSGIREDGFTYEETVEAFEIALADRLCTGMGSDECAALYEASKKEPDLINKFLGLPLFKTKESFYTLRVFFNPEAWSQCVHQWDEYQRMKPDEVKQQFRFVFFVSQKLAMTV